MEKARRPRLFSPAPEECQPGSLPTIWRHAAAVYSVADGPPYLLTDCESEILQAFARCPAYDLPGLIAATGNPHVLAALRRLRSKYAGAFARAIAMARKKGAGGYRAILREAETYEVNSP